MCANEFGQEEDQGQNRLQMRNYKDIGFSYEELQAELEKFRPLKREWHPWTETQIATAREMWNTHTPRQIAKALGRTEGSVWGGARRLGLARPRKWTRQMDGELKDMLAKALAIPEIATALQKSRSSIKSRIYDLNLRHPKAPKKWNKKEVAYLDENYGRLGPRGIATRLDRTAAAIQRKAYLRGFRRRKPKT